MKNPFYQAKRNYDLLAGFDPIKELMPLLSIFYVLLGWFTISIESFLRRDFGYRYYSRLNVFLGFIVLLFFAVTVNFWAAIFEFFSGGISFRRASTVGMTGAAAGGSSLGGWSWWIFALLGAYLVASWLHRDRIMFRLFIRRPLHTLSSGNPWLLPLGEWLMKKLNKGTTSRIRWRAQKLYSAEEVERLPEDFNPRFDAITFTQRVVEPWVVFLAGVVCWWMFSAGVIGLWLIMSAIGLKVYADMRHSAQINEALDLMDMQLESEEMGPAMLGKSKRMHLPGVMRVAIAETAAKIDTPEKLEEVEAVSHSVATAMAAVNPKLREMMERRRRASSNGDGQAGVPTGLRVKESVEPARPADLSGNGQVENTAT